jgi:hypothetical protein
MVKSIDGVKRKKSKTIMMTTRRKPIEKSGHEEF